MCAVRKFGMASMFKVIPLTCLHRPRVVETNAGMYDPRGKRQEDLHVSWACRRPVGAPTCGTTVLEIVDDLERVSEGRGETEVQGLQYFRFSVHLPVS